MSEPTTKSKLAEIMSAMDKAAATGDPDAVTALRAETAGVGTITEAPVATATLPPSLSVALRRIARPNGEAYHVRKLGPHDDIALLRAAREKGISVLASGEPGTGKTALIEAAYAGEDQTGNVFTVQGSGDTDVADFIGGWVPLPGGQFKWIDGPLIKAMEAGDVLYVDELPLIDPKVTAVLYGTMDGRGELPITQNPERGTIKAAPGFYVAAACNPNAPGARMSEALTSRFGLQIIVTTDYALATRLGVERRVVTAAQNLDKKRRDPSGTVGWAPQLRELLVYRDLAAIAGQAVALSNMVSSAPERDRDEVASVLTRTMGQAVQELSVG